MDQFSISELLVSAVPTKSVDLRDSPADEQKRRRKRPNPKPENAEEARESNDEEDSHALDILA